VQKRGDIRVPTALSGNAYEAPPGASDFPGLERQHLVRLFDDFEHGLHVGQRTEIAPFFGPQLQACAAGKHRTSNCREVLDQLRDLELIAIEVFCLDPAPGKEDVHLIPLFDGKAAESESIPNSFWIIGIDNDAQFHAVSPLMRLTIAGMKNEKTNSTRENITFHPSRSFHCPLAQMSRTVPTAKVKMNVPTRIPKAVPKK